MTRLYEDENFVREKAALEEQIMQASKATTESKSFIREMDDFLKDLESWKKTRTVLQDSADVTNTTDTKNEEEYTQNEDKLREIEQEFLRKADEREQQILEKLRALNIDPHSGIEEESKQQIMPVAQA